MFPIFMLIVTVIVMIIHIGLTRKRRTTANIIEIILLDYFIVAVGIGQTMAGLEHIFNGPQIARGIGWAPGSPFQYEVGVANVAIGIAALISVWFRGAYWLAVAIIGGIFGLGAGIGHIRDIIVSGNMAAYNAGPILYLSDGILPVLLIILVCVHLKMTGKKSRK